MPGITFIGPDKDHASGRLRCDMPATWLYQNGFEPGNDLLVVGKHCWPDDFTRGWHKYIFDVCDDHFDSEWSEHYLKHCEKATAVTCNTPVMAEKILYHTGRVASVIPDPVEGKRQAPHIGYGLLWFGHQSNFPQLKRIMPEIPEEMIEVISDYDHPLTSPYSEEALEQAFEMREVVLLPVDSFKPAKSNNRLIRSIQAGLFVIAEPHPSHAEFREFNLIWSNVAEGLQWLRNNPELVYKSIIQAQRYIHDHYHINKIGELWKRAIYSALEQK